MQLLVGFSSAKKWHWMTYFVKLVEKSSFSHIYIRVIDGDKDVVCNIAPDEEQSIAYNDFIKYNNIEKEFPLSFDPSLLDDIIKKLKPESQVYNFFKIFSIGLTRLMGNPKSRSAKYFWSRGKGIICTEYAYGVIVAAGYALNIDIHSSGPKQFFEFFKTMQDTQNK